MGIRYTDMLNYKKINFANKFDKPKWNEQFFRKNYICICTKWQILQFGSLHFLQKCLLHDKSEKAEHSIFHMSLQLELIMWPGPSQADVPNQDSRDERERSGGGLLQRDQLLWQKHPSTKAAVAEVSCGEWQRQLEFF